MEEERKTHHQDTRQYLHYITNDYYSFQTSLSRVWTNPEKVEKTTEKEPFYQLVPEKEDNGFFEWYNKERPYNQFFKTKETCITYFVNHWTEWIRRGKIKWENVEK